MPKANALAQEPLIPYALDAPGIQGQLSTATILFTNAMFPGGEHKENLDALRALLPPASVETMFKEGQFAQEALQRAVMLLALTQDAQSATKIHPEDNMALTQGHGSNLPTIAFFACGQRITMPCTEADLSKNERNAHLQRQLIFLLTGQESGRVACPNGKVITLVDPREVENGEMEVYINPLIAPKRTYSTHGWDSKRNKEVNASLKGHKMKAWRYGKDPNKRHLSACPFTGCTAAEYQKVTGIGLHSDVPASAVFGPDGKLYHMIDILSLAEECVIKAGTPVTIDKKIVRLGEFTIHFIPAENETDTPALQFAMETVPPATAILIGGESYTDPSGEKGHTISSSAETAKGDRGPGGLGKFQSLRGAYPDDTPASLGGTIIESDTKLGEQWFEAVRTLSRKTPEEQKEIVAGILNAPLDSSRGPSPSSPSSPSSPPPSAHEVVTRMIGLADASTVSGPRESYV